MPSYPITLHGADREAMADLVRAHRVGVFGQTLNDDAETPKLEWEEALAIGPTAIDADSARIAAQAEAAASSRDPLSWLAEREAERVAAGLRTTLQPRGAVETVIDLASNDYLGLARDPRVIQGAVDAVRTWGAGSTGSRLATGSTELHAELEAELATFCGTDAALVFSSGYTANLGAVTALSGAGSLIVSDAGSHASLVDACRLSRARVVVVPSHDVDAVDAALATRRCSLRPPRSPPRLVFPSRGPRWSRWSSVEHSARSAPPRSAWPGACGWSASAPRRCPKAPAGYG